jgi:hypothetical protein
MGGRGANSQIAYKGVKNGFNGKEHAVQIKFDDGTTATYRIKGTKMYMEETGLAMSTMGNNSLIDVPVNQAEKLMNNAKKNGVKAKLITPSMLKKQDADRKKAREEAEKKRNPRHSKKGINRHSAFWSGM